MPPKPAGDLIREHGEQLAALNQRADHLQVHLDKFEVSMVDIKRSHQDLDKQVALLTGHLERLDKKLEESQSRRWEILKLVIAAILGAIISSGIGIVTKMLERNITILPIGEKR